MDTHKPLFRHLDDIINGLAYHNNVKPIQPGTLYAFEYGNNVVYYKRITQNWFIRTGGKYNDTRQMLEMQNESGN